MQNDRQINCVRWLAQGNQPTLMMVPDRDSLSQGQIEITIIRHACLNGHRAGKGEVGQGTTRETDE